MTPGARVAAAIEVLDLYLEGTAAEQALTGWARGHRFAGSKDRAAIRDHVFDALRRLRSAQALGGGEDGRAIMIGLLRGQGIDPETLFTGEGYAAPVLTDEEREAQPAPTGAAALDSPQWLWPMLQDSLGDDVTAVLDASRNRAPVFLRVNLGKTTMDEAITALAREDIVVRPAPLASSALEVLENPRRVHNSRAYQDGLVELQDAASQAVIEMLDIKPGMRVLDYCAGGGGKALALAALGAEVVAHDISPQRMKDLPDRAERAGVHIKCVSSQDLKGNGGFDLVFADAPCSGSGSWRRAPHGKWLLTPEKLDEVVEIQSEILSALGQFATDDGQIAYATCSVLKQENSAQIDGFLAKNPAWSLAQSQQFLPGPDGDGFFAARLIRV